MMAIAADPIGRLRGLVAWLPELGEDGAWLAGVLLGYLDPFSGNSLDQAAGLLPSAGAEHWRTAARRALRDQAILALAEYFPGGLSRSRCAVEISRLLDRYASTRWRVDQVRPAMPEAYIGAPHAHLYAALVAGGGRVPGVSRIRQILAIRCGVFIVSPDGETATVNRRLERIGGTDRATDGRC